MLPYLRLIGYFVILMVSAELFAAPAVPSIGIIDASQVGQGISQRMAPTPSAQGVSLPSSEAETIPEALTKVKFKLVDISIEGNTVVSKEELAKLYQEKLNTEVSLADLFNLREDITTAYREAGYILVKVVIPAQHFDEKAAKVKFQVIEGFVEKIRIEGDASPKQKLQLESFAKQVLKSKPLQTKVLERYALLSTDMSPGGLEVNYVLAPSASTFGASELVVKTKRISKVDGHLQYDNFGTVLLGPEQGSGLLTLHGPGGTLHEFNAVGLATTHVDELQYMLLSDRYPIGPYGTFLTTNLFYTHTHPGQILELFDIFGQYKSLQFNLTHPVVRSRTKNFNASIIGDGLMNSSKTKFLDATFYEDQIRSVRGTLEYDEVRWNGVSQVIGTLSQGLLILGAKENPTSTAPLSRPEGRADYTKLFGEMSRLQFTDSNFSIYAAAQGLWGFVPLLTAEQFAFGGPIFGRGLDIAELLGDRGIGTKSEIRYDTKPEWGALKTAQFYAFYDYGAIWNIDDENFPSTLSAATLGGGIRIALTSHMDIDLYAAKPVVRGVATRDFSKEVRYLLSVIIRS